MAKARGQVLAEYVAMLACASVLAFALLALFSGVSVYGRRLVELVSFDIP